MATAVITITNISNQVVPILVNEIPLDKAAESSGLPAGEARQLLIQAGTSITIESQRLDRGQLDQLRRKRLLSYS